MENEKYYISKVHRIREIERGWIEQLMIKFLF